MTRATRELRIWRAIAVLTGALVMVYGAGQAWNALAEQADVRPFSYSERITAVELDLGSASAQVVGGTDGELTVRQTERWALSRPQITRRVVGSTLRITARCPKIPWIGGAACGAGFRLVVPPATAVSLKASSGAFSAEGLSGDLNLSTDSGSIRLKNLTGRVAARLTSGSLSGEGLASPELQAEVDSGSVDLALTAPPRALTMVSTSGSVRAALPPDTRYRLVSSYGSGSGHVAPALQDPGSPRSITVTTDSGSVDLDYTSG
ncbi:DUF4097 family beta strand repeat-containing protein [Kitasatospora azatica]|uniref:DUF4097 family beta strand repeat-containing protein n=1 Tax=Kitasatospora azatica TaxID=58347 RepID=UPI0005669C68|nr:DUF4097 family beta strand repeat-containing protein [Kitasatospora azatica]